MLILAIRDFNMTHFELVTFQLLTRPRLEVSFNYISSIFNNNTVYFFRIVLSKIPEIYSENIVTHYHRQELLRKNPQLIKPPVRASNKRYMTLRFFTS